MTLQIVSMAVLVAAFVLATLRPLNLGAIALVGTFAIGSLAAGLPADETFAGFPADLLVVLVGVTYLFNVARANGTVDWLVAGAVRLVRGRTIWVPWIMFGTAAMLSGIGAVYAVAFMAPIALGFAVRNRIPQFLMGLMIIHGWGAGALSPISVYGVIVDGVMVRSGLPSDRTAVFAAGLAANVVAAAVVFTVLGGLRLRSRVAVHAGGPAPEGDASTGPPAAPPFTLEVGLTVAAIIALVVGAIAGLDIGLLGVTLAIALGLRNARHHREAVAAIPWPVVLLVCGVLTYVGVLERIGTIDFIGGAVTAIGLPLVAALVLAYIGALVSAFATSSGVLAALIPLAVPLLDTSSLAPVAVVAALAVAATIVDVSPFSTNGAIVVANTTADERDAMLRNLLVYGGVVVLVAPLVLWAALVVPSGG
ncbi:SLC13 family permease [Pseudonocardia kunmingensis]|uniref:UIT1 family transporter n=1 Tax=Pseudonocardia kunmingensis TaxID=630975 RepID=A0A543DLC0_9PSEU|nr:SLC13 family permease [Pseudonocardia kunmingensis]TQM10103.1 UIT1 family transporter [Pseudonocardia kunmingensis]